MSAGTSHPVRSGAPYVLAPNQPRRPYRGGAGIAALRGAPQVDDHRPEDFLASTTSAYGTADVGQSRLPDGTALRDAVEQDPEWFLGADHVERHGPSTRLLVKLLNPQQRLFVHLHPDDDFARAHLQEPNGKTEAWVVLDTPPGGAEAYLGFTDEVSPADVARWVAEGDSADLLGRMNRLALQAGDALLVPAGLAHALSPGLTILELQQPSDLSVLLEWRGFDGLTAGSATLGLTPAEVFEALETTGRSSESLEALRVPRADPAAGGVTSLLPPEADRFFCADLLDAASGITLEPSFAVLVVAAGVGDLAWDGGTLGIGRGDVVLLPHGLGEVRLSGDLHAVRCRPPEVG